MCRAQIGCAMNVPWCGWGEGWQALQVVDYKAPRTSDNGLKIRVSVVRFRPWPYPLQTIRVGHRVWNIVLNAERQGVLRSSYPDLRCLASSRPDLAAVVVNC